MKPEVKNKTLTLAEEREKLEERLKEIKKEFDDLGKANPFRPKYKVEIIIQDDNEKETESIFFKFTLKNKREYHEYIRTFGSCTSYYEEFNSVSYYRFGNTLLNRHGGHLILYTPSLCSDKEWEELKQLKFGVFLKDYVKQLLS